MRLRDLKETGRGWREKKVELGEAWREKPDGRGGEAQPSKNFSRGDWLLMALH